MRCVQSFGWFMEQTRKPTKKWALNPQMLWASWSGAADQGYGSRGGTPNVHYRVKAKKGYTSWSRLR